MNTTLQILIASALLILGVRAFLAPLVDLLGVLDCGKSEIED